MSNTFENLWKIHSDRHSFFFHQNAAEFNIAWKLRTCWEHVWSFYTLDFEVECTNSFKTMKVFVVVCLFTMATVSDFDVETFFYEATTDREKKTPIITN